jgi:hypothetical protein
VIPVHLLSECNNSGSNGNFVIFFSRDSLIRKNFTDMLRKVVAMLLCYTSGLGGWVPTSASNSSPAGVPGYPSKLGIWQEHEVVGKLEAH